MEDIVCAVHRSVDRSLVENVASDPVNTRNAQRLTIGRRAQQGSNLRSCFDEQSRDDHWARVCLG